MKLGDLTVGIIVDSKDFYPQLNKMRQYLEKFQSDLTKVTSGGATNIAKIAQQEEKAARDRIKTLSAEEKLAQQKLRTQREQNRLAGIPTGEELERKRMRNQQIQLQQQYYQTASLQRMAFIVAALTATITIFGKKAVEAFMNFEQKMADARAAAQATDTQFAKMTEMALQMGRSTIFSAQETAIAMELLAKAGYQAADVMKTLDGAMLLAGATGESLEGGVALLVAVLHQFEIATERSGEAANILAGGAQFSLATVQNLGQGLKFLGSTAHQFNISLDETVTALAALSNAGIRMQMSGRLLSSALQTLNMNNVAVRNGLDQLRIKFNEVAPATHSLIEIIKRFEQAQRDLGDAQRFSAGMTTIFGKESSRVMIPLVTLGEKGFGGLLKRIEQTGNATAMMIMRTDTLQYALKELSNVFQNLLIGIGRATGTGGFKGFVQGLTELLRGIEANGESMLRFVGVVGPYIIGIGMATTVTVGLTAGVAGLSLAMNELSKATVATSLAGLSFFGTTKGILIVLGVLTTLTVAAITAIQRMGDTFERESRQIKKANLEFEINKYQAEALAQSYGKITEELSKVNPKSSEYTGLKEQQLNVISQLTSLFPDLLDKLDLEKTTTEDLNALIKEEIKLKQLVLEADREKARPGYEKEIKRIEDFLRTLRAVESRFPEGQIKHVYKGMEISDEYIRAQKAKLEKIYEEIYGEEEGRKLYEKYWGKPVKVKLPETTGEISKKAETEMAKISELGDEAFNIYNDIVGRINKVTLNRYQLERTEIERTYQENMRRLEKLLEEGKITQREFNTVAVAEGRAKDFALNKIDEDRLEKVRELLKKEQWETEKAGLEGLALKRAQANQEFEDRKADLDKMIKEGEMGWGEYAQAIAFARITLKNKNIAIAEDEADIIKKLQNEIADQEMKLAIDRATGREKELLQIEFERKKALDKLQDDRRKELANVSDNEARIFEIKKYYKDLERVLNEEYDLKKQEALAKMEPLQAEVLKRVIDSMTDLVTVTKDWGEYFKQTIQSLIVDLGRLFLKIMLAKAAMSIFSASAGDIGGILGIPAAILTAFKAPTPAMAGTPGGPQARMPVLPLSMIMPRFPGLENLKIPTPVVRTQFVQKVIYNNPINLYGDVYDWDTIYRKKIKPAQQRYLSKRFE